jgi:hypothetical protein
MTSCPKFLRLIGAAKTVGSKYVPPNQNQMSGPLLDALFTTKYDEMMKTLLLESRIYGVTIFGDGATITNIPLLNILAASPNNPVTLLEIVDCTNQMASEGKKDVIYLASVVRPFIKRIKEHANTREGEETGYC